MIRIGKRVQQLDVIWALTAEEFEFNVTFPDGRQGTVLSVERESGDGRSFNLTVLVEGNKETVFVRTEG